MRLASIMLVNAGLAIPLTFFSVGLPSVMRDAGVSLTMIGLTALVYLPYAFAFVWAPLVDTRSLGALGRRRSWIVVMQIAMAAFTALAAVMPPDQGVAGILLLAVLISVFGATARTALFGYVVETLSPDKRPWGGAALPAGGALGALIGASGLIVLYGRLGWDLTMAAMAGLLVVFLLPIALVDETSSNGRWKRAPRPSIRRFFKRPDVLPVLVFLMPLAIGIGLGFGMVQPRLVDLGLTLDQIGLINGVFTCVALFTGGPLAAFLIGRFGLAAILPAGIALNAATLVLMASASYWQLSAVYGAASVVFFYFGFSFIGVMTNTIFMNRSEAGQEGTDLTLFVCIFWLLSMIGIGFSGFVADNIGYAATFAAGAIVLSGSLAFVQRLRLRSVPEGVSPSPSI